MTASDLPSLHGQSVLVRSTRDPRNPPIAMRGTIAVHPAAEANEPATVKLLVDFPDMFNSKAHQRTITLSPADLTRLKPAERGGFEFSTDQALT